MNLKIVILAGILLMPLISCYYNPRAFELDIFYPEEKLPPNSRLFIRGGGATLSWDYGLPLRHSDKDHFTIQLPSLTPLEFKILINDSIWQKGKNLNLSLIPNSNPVFYPYFFETEGHYFQLPDQITSSLLDNTRTVSVYLPPSYIENPYSQGHHTEILIMSDGQMVFGPETSKGETPMHAEQTFDSLIAQDLIPQVIAIAPWSNQERINEYTYSYDEGEQSGGDGDLYLDFVEQELLPWVRGYVKFAEDYNPVLQGASLGGLISCYSCWTRQFYNACICLSSSFWWNKQDFEATVMEEPPKDTETIFYLDSGDTYDCIDSLIVVREKFEADYSKLEHMFYVDKGATHNFEAWGKRFYIPMQFIYNGLSMKIKNNHSF